MKQNKNMLKFEKKTQKEIGKNFFLITFLCHQIDTIYVASDFTSGYILLTHREILNKNLTRLMQTSNILAKCDFKKRDFMYKI